MITIDNNILCLDRSFIIAIKFHVYLLSEDMNMADTKALTNKRRKITQKHGFSPTPPSTTYGQTTMNTTSIEPTDAPCTIMKSPVFTQDNNPTPATTPVNQTTNHQVRFSQNPKFIPTNPLTTSFTNNPKSIPHPFTPMTFSTQLPFPIIHQTSFQINQGQQQQQQPPTANQQTYQPFHQGQVQQQQHQQQQPTTVAQLPTQPFHQIQAQQHQPSTTTQNPHQAILQTQVQQHQALAQQQQSTTGPGNVLSFMAPKHTCIPIQERANLCKKVIHANLNTTITDIVFLVDLTLDELVHITDKICLTDSLTKLIDASRIFKTGNYRPYDKNIDTAPAICKCDSTEIGPWVIQRADFGFLTGLTIQDVQGALVGHGLKEPLALFIQRIKFYKLHLPNVDWQYSGYTMRNQN